HLRRNGLLDRRFDGPAALAGILDEAGKILQLRILRKRRGAEIEQPGGDHAAAPPDLRDVRDVEHEALLLRQVFRVLVAKNAEALRIGLHQPVLDAVVHHLDEMPGAGRAGMDIAALGPRVARRAAWRARDVAEAGSKRCKNWIEALNGLLGAADHHAVAALNAPDAPRGAAIDITDALLGESLRPADVVLVEGIPAIDDDVVTFQKTAQTLDRLLGDLAGGQHYPDSARLFIERLHHLRERPDGGCALLGQRLARFGIRVEDDAMVPRLHQAPGDVAAHAAETDYADLHCLRSL